jgi:putative ABC transport system permease protein
VAGGWVADEADGLSVEEGLATTLGLKLGDTLRFDIAGISRKAASPACARWIGARCG